MITKERSMVILVENYKLGRPKSESSGGPATLHMWAWVVGWVFDSVILVSFKRIWKNLLFLYALKKFKGFEKSLKSSDEININIRD